jgi:hypothetical protein
MTDPKQQQKKTFLLVGEYHTANKLNVAFMFVRYRRTCKRFWLLYLKLPHSCGSVGVPVALRHRLYRTLRVAGTFAKTRTVPYRGTVMNSPPTFKSSMHARVCLSVKEENSFFLFRARNTNFLLSSRAATMFRPLYSNN